MKLENFTRLACLVLPALVAATAQAQGSFPNKPIHIIVGFAAGGGNDIIVRVLAPKMSEGLGRPIIVENKPGAQSIIAAEYVAKSAPDGYTLFMGPSGAMTMNPAIYSKLPYSPLKDFEQISMIGDFPLILVVYSSLPVNSVKDLIDYAKARPGDVNYSASAAPFQLAAELFNQKEDRDAVRAHPFQEQRRLGGRGHGGAGDHDHHGPAAGDRPAEGRQGQGPRGDVGEARPGLARTA